MKVISFQAANQAAEDAPDPREDAMEQVGLSESEKEKFRRSWQWEQAAGKPRDRDDSLDAVRLKLARRMLRTAPNGAISTIKALLHERNQPPRLHTVAGRGVPVN